MTTLHLYDYTGKSWKNVCLHLFYVEEISYVVTELFHLANKEESGI